MFHVVQKKRDVFDTTKLWIFFVYCGNEYSQNNMFIHVDLNSTGNSILFPLVLVIAVICSFYRSIFEMGIENCLNI
jgi:hypothetical protein